MKVGKNKQKLVKVNFDGSFTVEASLIMPLIIFIIITLIYFAFYLHDQACLQAIANQVAEKGTESLLYNEVDIDEGSIVYNSINERAIYWRFTDNCNSKTNNIISYGESESKDRFFNVRSKDVVMDLAVNSNLLNKCVQVNMQAPFKTPLKFVNELLNNGKSLNIKVSSKANMNDSVEFIRNIDLINQKGDEIECIKNVKSKYDEAINKVKDYMMK